MRFLREAVLASILCFSSTQVLLAVTITCTLIEDGADINSSFYEKEFEIDTSSWIIKENVYFSDGTFWEERPQTTVIQTDQVLGWIEVSVTEENDTLPEWGSISSYVLDRESLIMMESIVAATSFSTPFRRDGATKRRCVIDNGL